MQDDSNLAMLHLHFRNKQGINMEKKTIDTRIAVFSREGYERAEIKQKKITPIAGRCLNHQLELHHHCTQREVD